MKTSNVCIEISLVAVATLGACGWSCTVKSGDSTDSGGVAACTDPRACFGPTAPAPAAPAAGAMKLPCDIFADDGGPCVAAHSTVRALYATYTGPLYQVKKATDGTTRDISPLAAGGLANSADQDTFCGTNSCSISIIYDQSGWGNHLTSAPAGMAKTTPDNEANAKSAAITISGQKVYGIHIVPGIGYRNNTACGTAACDAPETEYMVVAGAAYNASCCFDYGNMETNSRDNGEGTMEAVYFGNCTVWNKGAGDGPWVMGDLENGLWAGDSSPFMGNMPITTWPYVTGLVKGESTGGNWPNGHWTIKEGNATSGTLMVPFDGKRPSARYNPMRKEGAIGLGTGGDNTNGAKGDWFEGVMTAAYSSNAADDAVQANVVSVYGQ